MRCGGSPRVREGGRELAHCYLGFPIKDILETRTGSSTRKRNAGPQDLRSFLITPSCSDCTPNMMGDARGECRV
jgi:hypothetical protein